MIDRPLFTHGRPSLHAVHRKQPRLYAIHIYPIALSVSGRFSALSAFIKRMEIYCLSRVFESCAPANANL
ncbi:hypothetical protein SPHINGO391_350374 [Sphingomonas aurantiaca]|uniref:Uncharacterized protein n=1 Tax=Sphingomonas aurantiaca TaxID=185949 RepID=A0A5E7YCS8_9SPHN|nr:hypothetical protein SPHINGO391_350374 [Sphingomonas aurantiaca]